MPENRRRSIWTAKPGVIDNLVMRVKLIMRLMGDRRVNPLFKLIPIGSLIYLVIPDIPGPFDDAAVLWLGSYLFVQLCPPAVVAEHLAALKRTAPTEWHESPSEPERKQPTDDDDVIDGKFREE